MKASSFANIAIALAAVGLTFSVVRDELDRSRASTGRRDPRSPPTLVSEWNRILPLTTMLDSLGSTLEIVEFIDFECPACAAYDPVLRAFESRHSSLVRRRIAHFPLQMHRFSQRAAKAFECAASRGSADTMADVLLREQLDYSSNPWWRLAKVAGVQDSSGFVQCLADSLSTPKVDAGKRMAADLKLEGTPTIMINGYLYFGTPPDSVLEDALAAAVAGKSIGSSKRTPSSSR